MFKDITLTDEILKSFLSGLLSTNKKDISKAYNGIASFYDILDENQLNRVNDAIMSWRKPNKPTPDMLVSFNLVSPNKEELPLLIGYLENKVLDFLNVDAVITTNSTPIQKATSTLGFLSYVTSYLDLNNKKKILVKIENVLNENKDILFKEKNDLYGFFDFGGDFISTVTRFISSLNQDQFEDILLGNIITLLQNYLEHGFAVLGSIVKLNLLLVR